ncbi:MAG: glutathione S-transferase C-terminal domain-containing protein [Pseudomonadota bacterium]|nr:glutathione S-transferase C-terminal domain-containing protein [Pseudomonadota bacterium]
MDGIYRVAGQNGSPYSMKMRAIFRYRRLPHIWQQRDAGIRAETAHVKPQMVPMVRFPEDGIWRIDSTPIAMELEARHAERSILPSDPVHRFLSDLIEDMADEWLTKAMFHYRWFYAADRDFAAWWIASDFMEGSRPLPERRAFAAEFGARQVGRMALVGCTDENRGAIEESFGRIVDALETHVGLKTFLFGSRPSLADFGLFGQLKTLADDPTPMTEMRRRAPTVVHWVRQTDDLSGIEGEWASSGAPLPDAVAKLLDVCGDSYLPFLAANADAAERGADEVRLTIRGRPFAQAPFRYQVKCLSRLKSLYARLTGDDKARADAVLAPAGCLDWLR